MNRREAIEHLENDWYIGINEDLIVNESYKDGFTQAIEIATKALKQQDWIPCSERLPEESGRYLITGECVDKVYIGYYYKERSHINYRWTFGSYDYAVIAWMPLPELYRE